MAYKTILVHVDTDQRSSSRVDFAASLALHWGAHLVGMHIVAPPRVPSYVRGELGSDFLAVTRERQQAIIDVTAKSFDDAMRRHGLVGSEWRAPVGDLYEEATLQARYADLVIVGQANPDDESVSVPANFAESLTLSCGRPVLAIPYAGSFEPNFGRVLVCWKPDSRGDRFDSVLTAGGAGVDSVGESAIEPVRAW